MISGNVMFFRDSRHQTDSTADSRSYLFRRGPQLNISIAVTSHVQTRFNALCHSNVSVFPQTQTHHLKADIHSSLQMFLIQLLLQAVILIITCCVRVALADCFYMLSNAIKIKFLPSLDPRRCLLALLRPKFTSESLPTSRPPPLHCSSDLSFNCLMVGLMSECKAEWDFFFFLQADSLSWSTTTLRERRIL